MRAWRQPHKTRHESEATIQSDDCHQTVQYSWNPTVAIAVKRRIRRMDAMRATAAQLCRPGYGILAADESTGTIGKRLISHGLENTAENRRAFREVILNGVGNEGALGGAILFDETLGQSACDGRTFVQLLNDKGILPGIKVDTGLKPLDGCAGESYTSGIDTLAERCEAYYARGARFAKWRAALKIDAAAGLPSEQAVDVNADLLARYAGICQSKGLVPIVEPELLIDGEHDIDVSAAAARRVITAVYKALANHEVKLEATLLKPMMIVPGKEYLNRKRFTPAQIARATLDVMKDVVPPQVAGIVFLSGGMTETEATHNLNAINVLAAEVGAPWQLSFSFGRGLQASALQIWANNREDAQKASVVVGQIALANGRAQLGKFQGEHPSQLKSDSLHENFRGWRSGEDKPGT